MWKRQTKEMFPLARAGARRIRSGGLASVGNGPFEPLGEVV